MRTIVIGDIHGAYKALCQVWQRAKITDDDHVIALGDVVDGWPESRRAMQFLMSRENAVYLLGNHDQWALEWMQYGVAPPVWLSQGGRATVSSFEGCWTLEPYARFLRNARLWHERHNRLFVHGGITIGRSLYEHDANAFLWDRSLWDRALVADIGEYVSWDEIYIGHTSIGDREPQWRNIVCNMDTGAGWEGRLSAMDVETKEVWQSDRCGDLYPEAEGRRRDH